MFPSAMAFVGRGRELATLRAALADTLAGRPRLLLVSGEAGIGKTRLVEELAAEAATRGASVVWGRCYEGEGTPAFWPWVQVLRTLLEGHDGGALLSGLGEAAADIVRLDPGSTLQESCSPAGSPLSFRHPEPETLIGQARFHVFDSVTRLLCRVAAYAQPDRPRSALVVLLDDLHWADAPSLALLRFLARDLRVHAGVPLLVVAAFRDTDVRRGDALAETLSALAREPHSLRIDLRGLGKDEARRLITFVAGSRPPDALVRAIHAKTEGNPFFVVEIARMLAAGGHIDGDGFDAATGDLSPSLPLPPTVRDLLSRRLDQLPADCLRVLTVAAVIGREFSIPVLERASQLAGDPLLKSLEAAEERGFIAAVPGGLGRYRFVHAVIRDALYEDLPTTRRMRLHRQVGEALEIIWRAHPEPHLTDLATHFFHGAPGGAAEKAVNYAGRAADRAMALLAYEEAARLYEMAVKALELQQPPIDADLAAAHDRRRCELLLALGRARERAGERTAARDSLERAAAIGRVLAEPELLARVAIAFPIAFEDRDADSLVIGVLEDARAALGETDHALRAMVLAHLAEAMKLSQRRDALSGEALALARRLNDPAALLTALEARHIALGRPDQLAERAAIAAEIVGLAEWQRNDELAVLGHWLRISDLLALGDVSALEAAIEAHGRLAATLRQPTYLWQAATVRATLALMQGRFDEAEERAQAALAIGQQMEWDGAIRAYMLQMYLLRGNQGRLAELQPLIRDVISRDLTWVGYRAALALAYAESGRVDEARAELDRAATHDFADVPNDRYWLNVMVTLAQVCISLGDVGRAALIYDRLLPYERYNVVVGWATACNGAAARSLGLLAAALGRPDEAERHFEMALALNERMGARLWVVRTRVAYATMLFARGRRDDLARALHLATAALAEAEQIGMVRLIPPITALIERLERALTAVPVKGAVLPDGLTRREAEVLRLLAEGKTNSEIADELVISVYTVIRHVAHIYQKIGARRRLEAAAYAQRHGLASLLTPDHRDTSTP